ncbi:MAG: 30S ribosome-binding factor RbfA [Chloroflexi bacterium]|nr:MAG: 30S ribosome-binding factor RbfA [Chloroflexota bacterium]
MASEIRLQRIADRIKRELSEMLIFELSDPRLKGIYITDVNIDRELAFANIYISAIEGSTRAKEALAGFNSASGFIRRILAGRVELRSFPHLKFHWDPTPEQADQIEGILAEIRKDEEQRAENEEKTESND